MANGATFIGGASGGGLYGATSDDIIYAPGGSGTLEAAYGRDVIFLDPLDVAQSRLVYSGVGEVDGDVVFVFGPKDSIQLHSYDYFSSYTPSALSFVYGVLSVDLDEDGVVDARIAFPDLPDETLWLGIENQLMLQPQQKGDLLVQQFVPGFFTSDVLPIIGDSCVNTYLVSETSELQVYRANTSAYGVVEARISGVDLTVSSDEGESDYSFARGTATGMEILSDGAPWLSFSGLDEPVEDLINTIIGYADRGDRAGFDATLAGYHVIWDASEAGERVVWDGPALPFGATLMGGDGYDTFHAHDGDAVFPGSNTGNDSIMFLDGNTSADLSAAAYQPKSFYSLWMRWDENYQLFDQGVVAQIGLTDGTVEYGNVASRGVATLTGLDAPTFVGGFAVYTGIGDDVISIQNEADL
jgi:hypothetical protein